MLLSGCGQAKEPILAQCRMDAAKAVPNDKDNPFQFQVIDNFVRDCATTKGLVLEGWRDGCPRDSVNPEREAACYRWAWERATPRPD
jgi:hypothetical protein